MLGGLARFSTAAALLSALLALAAIALVAVSWPRVPPRFTDLAIIEGTLHSQSFGVSGTTLRLATGSGMKTFDAATCAPFTGKLKAGDRTTVWVDARSRVWRVARENAPICTFLHATVSDEASRRSRRITALVLAIASAACIGVTVVGQRRSRL